MAILTFWQSLHFRSILLKVIHTSVLALLSFILCTEPLLSQSESLSNDLIPSLNYWEARSAIQQSHELQKRLNISEEQLEQLSKLGRNEMLVRLFSNSRVSSGAKKMSSKVQYGMFDKEVKDEMGKFLGQNQIDRIRPEWLAMKFPCGFLPFTNPELRLSLKLSDVEMEKLDAKVEKAFSQFKQSRKKSVEAFSKAVVQEIPDSCRISFAQYIGDKYFPGMPLDATKTLDDLPFEQIMVFSTNTTTLLASGESPQEMRLSLSQSAELNELDSAAKRLEGTGNLKACDTLVRERLPQILTAEQLVQVGRYWSCFEFEKNPRECFLKRNVVEYIGLSREDHDSLLKFIDSNSRDEKEKLAKWNCQVFELLCIELPPETASRLKALFQGTWEVR